MHEQPEERVKELKQLIADANDEITDIEGGMDWKDACRYMYETAQKGSHMQIEDVMTKSRFHSYEGIGILYTRHAIENYKSKYKKV